MKKGLTVSILAGLITVAIAGIAVAVVYALKPTGRKYVWVEGWDYAYQGSETATMVEKFVSREVSKKKCDELAKEGKCNVVVVYRGMAYYRPALLKPPVKWTPAEPLGSGSLYAE